MNINIYKVVYRVASHLENLEKSGNLSGHGKVRENGKSQRKVRENVFLHV